MPNVKNAQALRLDRWRTDPAIDTDLASEINRKRSAFFRVFDSGDFTTTDDVDRWRAIAAACPDKRFWIPTRTWRLGPEWIAALVALNRLPNVVVRASGLRWNIAPDDVGLPIATMVNDDTGDCPATRQGTDCKTESCRKCWDKDNAETKIDAHGSPVNWRKRLAA